MFWIIMLLAVLALGGYAVSRVKRPGQPLRYGPPELYVAPEPSSSRPRGDAQADPDLEFIRGLRLPESSDGLKPRARPAPADLRPAAAAQTTPSAYPQEVGYGPPAPAYPTPGAPPASQNGYGDPTLQLLPGRLEVISGMPGDSIRFIKQPGVTQAVTLGRTRGEPGSHVQIPSPTVSRMHVRMSFEGGSWTLENLSETNPVAINGRPATGRGARCVLSEGDRIEMGDVAFYFRRR